MKSLYIISQVAFLLATTEVAEASLYRASRLPVGGFPLAIGRGATNATQVGAGRAGMGESSHALLWDESAGSVIDLNPVGYLGSDAGGAAGDIQYGNAHYRDGSAIVYHAHVWYGSAVSAINVHPTGFEYSDIDGVSNGRLVGSGYGNHTGGNFHALFWPGLSNTVVDLNPSGINESFATDMDEGVQVGSVRAAIGAPTHAGIWRGTAASFVDIHPSGYKTSHAWGIAAGMVAGSAIPGTTNQEHALIWNLATSSVLDLNPTGFFGSEIRGVSDGFQVGFGWKTQSEINSHALVWRGTAGSAIDLHELLDPAAGYVRSVAFGVADDGDVVGWALTTSQETHAIKWTLVPEPGSLVLFACGLLAAVGTVRRVHLL